MAEKSLGIKLLKTLGKDSKIEKVEENFNRYLLSASVNRIEIEKELFQSIIQHDVDTQDTFSLSVNLEDDDPIILSSNDLVYENFFGSVESRARISPDEKFNIEIRIEKFNGNNISIYDLTAFGDFLNGIELKGLVSSFQNILEKHGSLILFNETIDEECSSSSISFLGSKSSRTIFEQRQNRINRIRQISHFTSKSIDFTLLPEDFSFNYPDSFPEKIKSALQNVLFALLINSLFDISSIESNNKLYYKLNGYKTVSGTLDVSDFSLDSIEVYLKIYRWLIEGGNVVDKAGVARNIISLHLESSKGLSISESTYLSIISSFKIYEKENIKQYIEIRSKISEQLLDYYKRASSITDNFVSGFQKSFVAVLTFFSSVIVIRVISKSNDGLSQLITLDTYILTLVFIVASAFYLYSSLLEIKSQRKRFIQGYNNLKERYQDLLISDDIQRIVNNDQEFNNDLDFIDNKRKWYRNLWISCLMLMLVATTYLCFKNEIDLVLINTYCHFFCSENQ